MTSQNCSSAALSYNRDLQRKKRYVYFYLMNDVNVLQMTYKCIPFLLKLVKEIGPRQAGGVIGFQPTLPHFMKLL